MNQIVSNKDDRHRLSDRVVARLLTSVFAISTCAWIALLGWLCWSGVQLLMSSSKPMLCLM
jgi:hypothetical protein